MSMMPDFASRNLMGANPNTYTPSWLPQGPSSGGFATSSPGAGATQGSAYPSSLNSNPAMTQSPNTPMAHGGRALAHTHHRHRGDTFIEAHFNPQELAVMDDLQGGGEWHRTKGKRRYGGLEHLLRNPHLMRAVRHHAEQHRCGGMAGQHHHLAGTQSFHGPVSPGMHPLHQHHAMGGSAQGHMSQHADPYSGRNGDTEIALIGPHTRRLLDDFAGRKTRNPDGHPEYFSLGSMFSGIGNALGGIGNTIWGGIKDFGRAMLPAAAPALGAALSSRFGMPQLAPLASQGISALGNAAFGQAPTGQPPSMGSQLGTAAGEGLRSYQGGASMPQAMGTAMSSMGQQMPNSPMGHAVFNTGEALQNGANYGQAAMQGAQTAFNKVGGMHGLGQMANDAWNSYRNGPGQTPMGALQYGMGRLTAPQMGPYPTAAQYGY